MEGRKKLLFFFFWLDFFLLFWFSLFIHMCIICVAALFRFSFAVVVVAVVVVGQLNCRRGRCYFFGSYWATSAVDTWQILHYFLYNNTRLFIWNCTLFCFFFGHTLFWLRFWWFLVWLVVVVVVVVVVTYIKKRERKRNRYMSTKCNNAGNFASTVRFIRLGHHSRCNAFYLHYHYDLFIFLGTRNALYFRFWLINIKMSWYVKN